MEKWVVAAKKADFEKIGSRFGIDPVIARLIRNRDIVGEHQIEAYLHGTRDDLPSPWQLRGMREAVDLIRDALAEKKKIRILGDYDIDGVMATCILMEGLKVLGGEADSCIPDRIMDGYGINDRLVDTAHRDGVELLITCDNGIAAVPQIANAKKLGMTVIVTDHHDIPYEETDGKREYLLPAADAIINPKQPDCPYPNKNICGAVVAWKLITALYEEYGLEKDAAMRFLDMAAFATIGDVMDLRDENRILVKEGLPAITNTGNEGLRQLILACGLEGRDITSYHVGFVLGPCINAGGRLDTAEKSLALLLEKDPETAAVMAKDLSRLNEERKEMTEQGVTAAIEQIEKQMLLLDPVLVVFLPDCHESLAGIIAGRIREKYNRPCIVLTRAERGVKGSGRSIEEYSMFEELTKCADLLDQFGGHPMAAGLSLREENIDAFRRKLNEECSLTQEDLKKKILIDAAMPIAYISRRLISQISLLEPFGKGNEKPLFAQKDLRVLDSRIVGKQQNVLRMHLGDANGVTMQAVYFGDAQKMYEELRRTRRVAVTYYPEINSFQGRESIQLIIQSYKAY